MASNAFYQAYVEIVPEGSKILPTLNKQMASAGAKSGKVAGDSISTGILGSVRGIAPAITGLIAGAVGALALGSAAKGGLDRLLNIEDAQAKLKGLGNDAETVTAIMNDALASVRGTAFGLDAAATTAAGAVAAGIKPGEELEKYLKLTADTATIAGTSLEDMGSIINKTTTTGKVFTDNLNQLADRGIPIFQYLADEYGVSADELSEMVSRGEVDAATFRNVLEKNIGGAALASGDTTRGAFKNMLASLNRVSANVLSGVFPQFKKAFQGITKFLGPVEDKAKAVGKALGLFFERGAKAASGLFAILGKGDFTAAFREATGLTEDSKLVDFLFNVREFALKAIPAVGGLFDILARGDFTAAFRDATGLTEDSPLVDFLFTVREKAIEAGSAIRENLGPVFGSIGDAIGPLLPRLLDLATQLSPLAIIFQTLGPELPKIADLLGSTLSDALEKIVSSGALSALATGLVTIVTALAPLIPKILELLPAVVDLIPPLVDLAVAVLPPLVDLLSKLLPPAVDLLKSALEAARPVITFLTENLGSLATGLGLVISYLSGDIGRDEFVGSITEIGGAIGGLVGYVTGLATSIFNFINTIILGFRLFATDVKTNIDNAVGFITSLPQRVVDGFGDLGTLLVGSGKSLIRGFIDGINEMFPGLDTAVGAVMDFVGGFFPNSPAKRGPLSGAGWTRILNSGAAVGDQFASGLSASTSSLAVGDVALPNVSATVRAVAQSGTSATPAARAPIQVNNYGADGMSAEAFGRVIVDGLNYQQKVLG